MDQLTNHGIDQAFTSGLLTATGAATTYDTTATINFSVNGELYQKTAITGGATPTTDINTGAAFVSLGTNKRSVFVWMMNNAGTVAVAQGEVVSTDESNLPIGLPQFPHIPTGYTPFAFHYFQTTAASAAFLFGTTNWTGTGFTKFIRNVSVLPARPQLPTMVTA